VRYGKRTHQNGERNNDTRSTTRKCSVKEIIEMKLKLVKSFMTDEVDEVDE